MPFGPDHERWADATGAYLLGALPEDEHDAFEAHAAACRFCREEIDFLRVASDALPAAVPQLPPPPELKSRIMAVVEREAQLLEAASPGAPSAPAGPADRTPWWRRLSLSPLRPALAIGAVLLLLAGVAGGALIGDGDGGPESRTLAGVSDSAGTEVRLVVAGDQARLEADGLPAPPRGRVYQVWVKRPNQDPRPTDALFVPSADGRAAAGVPGSIEDVEAVLVTDEPPGGSSAPTGTVVMSANVRGS